MNHNYIRPGGVAADLPDNWQKDIKEILKIIPEKLKDYDEMLLDNPIWPLELVFVFTIVLSV